MNNPHYEIADDVVKTIEAAVPLMPSTTNAETCRPFTVVVPAGLIMPFLITALM
jgi:hypothetical protein